MVGDSIDNLLRWLQLGQLVWMAVLTIGVWLRKPGIDAAAALDKAEAEWNTVLKALREDQDRRLGTVAERLTRVETNLEHMPSSEEMAKLEGTVRAIDERTEAMAETFGGLTASVRRIEDYLLNNKH